METIPEEVRKVQSLPSWGVVLVLPTEANWYISYHGTSETWTKFISFNLQIRKQAQHLHKLPMDKITNDLTEIMFFSNYLL